MIILKLFILIFIFFNSLSFLFPSNSLTIKGKISNITGEFDVYIALFNQEKNWLNPKNSVKKMIVKSNQIKNKKVFFQFTQLKPGFYAISTFEDVDSNGQLNEGLFGPTEPFGFFKNYEPTFGAPEFKDCSFEIKKKITKIQIPLLNKHYKD